MTPSTLLLYVALILMAVSLWGYLVKDAKTITGIMPAQTAQPFAASSLEGGGTSSNFAYSIWIMVNDWNYRYGEPKILFTRGTGTNAGCPTVALGSNLNNLQISLSLFGAQGRPGPVQRIVVPDVPLQRWVNLTVSVQGRAMDVYIDGKLVRTALLEGVVNVSPNSGVVVTPNGGFSGNTAKFKYYNEAIDPQEAWSIYSSGYGGNWLTQLIGNYAVKVSLLKGDTEESSLIL